LGDALQGLNMKIVVLDDDPTGTQTVHNIPVYTNWSKEYLKDGFLQPTSMFYVLTNSRSFSPTRTIEVHKEIVDNLLDVSKELSKDFIVISRSDSTLRGHYPLEPTIIKETLEADSPGVIDGEILCPFFIEGGRYTFDNIHYVKEGDNLIPAAETEFAQDKTFGYKNSDLTKWIEEKSNGIYSADDIESIPLEMLRDLDFDRVLEILVNAEGYKKIVVNAVSYWDLKVFVTALARALSLGKRFNIRSAAGIAKVLGGVSDADLLTKDDLIDKDNVNGGLIIIGSHVNKTTMQFEKLLELPGLVPLEFNQHLVYEPEKMAAHANEIGKAIEAAVLAGQTAVVYTRRDRIDAASGSQKDNLNMATAISDAISGMVNRLGVRPSFIIAKGGITSSDIATKGLEISKAMVAGQILKGIPVWLTDENCKFPHLPYVVFPGNVGEVDSLKKIVADLQKSEKGRLQ